MGYLDLVNGFVYKDPVFRAKLDALAENDAYLKLNGWQTSTKAVVFQAAAPTGWTKDTTNTGKALRVVSGVSGGSVGGSQDIATAIAVAHTAHTISTQAAHDHPPPEQHTHDFAIQAPNNRTGNVGYTLGSGDTPIRTCSTSGANTRNVLQPVLDNFLVASDEYDASSSAGSHSHTGNTQTAALTDIAFKYVDVLVCTKDTSSGYTDMTSAFSSGDEITYQDLDKLAENDKFNYLRLTPTGTVMPFGQVSAPTGWTKGTTHDDKALRVVSGTGGGNGGSTGFGTTVSLSHNHTTSSDGAHTHTLGNHRHRVREVSKSSIGSNDNGYVSYDGSDNLQATDGSGGTRNVVKGRTDKDGGGGTLSDPGNHTHSIGSSLSSIQMAYLDVIVAAKDSAGSSSVYTDMSAVWVFKILVSKQRLNKMSANDDYTLFHTVEAGSKTFFSMASPPIGWTKILTVNDKALRVVSGTSGGTTGGSQSISTVITIAHTHTIAANSHFHTVPSHQHHLVTYSEAAAGALGGLITGSTGGFVYLVESNSSLSEAFPVKRYSKTDIGNSTTIGGTHSHGGVTGSALSNVTLAYQDVIYCSKD